MQIDHDMRLLSRSHLGHLRIVRARKRNEPEQARRLMEAHIQAACKAVLAGYSARRRALAETI